MIFGSILALLAFAYYRTSISRVGLFSVAFITTRPRSARSPTISSTSRSHGGFELSPAGAFITLGIVILTLILALPQRAAAIEKHETDLGRDEENPRTQNAESE